MPRISLNRKKYVMSDLQDYVVGQRKRMKITQAQMAEKLDMKQTAYSLHERNMDFRISELVSIFDVLGTDEEQIGRMLKL